MVSIDKNKIIGTGIFSKSFLMSTDDDLLDCAKLCVEQYLCNPNSVLKHLGKENVIFLHQVYLDLKYSFGDVHQVFYDKIKRNQYEDYAQIEAKP